MKHAANQPDAGQEGFREVSREFRAFSRAPPQDPLIFNAVFPQRKTSPQLAKDDEWQVDGLSFLDNPLNLRKAAAKVRVTIGVQSQLHFHSSGSMVS